MSCILRWYSRVNYTVEFKPTQYFEKRFSMNFSILLLKYWECLCWFWLSSSWSSFIRECEGRKYENRSRCDARERLVDVGRLRYPYVTFYIMPVYHLQNFHLHWQFQIWFKISKYFNVEFCRSMLNFQNFVASYEINMKTCLFTK